MNRVGDNNDLRNAIMIWGLVDTTPNGKELCFSTSNIDHMIDNLGDGIIVCVYMRYRCSNIIFDTGICDNNSGRGEVWWLNNHVIKLLNVGFIAILFAMWIKY